MAKRTPKQIKRREKKRQRKAERMARAVDKREKTTKYHTRSAGEDEEGIPLFSIVRFDYPSHETPLRGRMPHAEAAKRCHALNKGAS